jgi:hypothetical protein
VTLNLGGTVVVSVNVSGGTGTVVTVNIEDLNGIYFTDVTLSATGGIVTINRIPSTNWLIKARKVGCVDEYYGETASTANASAVTVNGGQTTSLVSINIGLPWTVSGHVRNRNTLAPVAGITVDIYKYAQGFQYIDSTTTNALGDYFIDAGYNAGTVFVRVTGNNYVTQFYNNKTSWEISTPLLMNPGEATTNIDFDVYSWGYVTGTITETLLSQPVGGVTVSAFQASDNIWINNTTTTVDGTYVLSVVPGIPIIIKAEKPALYSKFYNNVSGDSWQTATSISVGEAGTSANINFNLVPYWRVGGTVSLTQSGNPNGCVVSLYPFSNTANPALVSTVVNSSGYYEFVSTNPLPTNNIMIVVSRSDIYTIAYPQAPTFSALPASANIYVFPGSIDNPSLNILATWQGQPIDPIPAGQSVADTIKSGPNPANPNKEPIHIGMILDTTAKVSVRVYTLGGDKVYENTRQFAPGYNEFVWDGDDLFGDSIPNGVYLAYIEVDTGNEKIKKVIKIAVLK